MRLTDFFATHPVFETEELAAFLARRDSRSRWTRKALLVHHEKQGRLLRVRRGLYSVVPTGADPATCSVDAYLLAAKMTDDAVVAYHTALELHGKAYSVFEELQYLTDRAAHPVKFRSYRFRPVRFPKKLTAKNKQLFGVKQVDRAGITVPVTTLERTLVDLLDRPDLGGGWEEIWRSLEGVEFFDLDTVVQYALLLDNATTAAKVGFFLEQHKDQLMVDASYLDRLRARRPRKPHYFERAHRRGRLVSNWNLIVPTEVLERSWAEVT